MKKVFTVKDFSGGLNTQDDLNSLEDNEFSELDNMTVVRGSKISMNTLFTSAVDLSGNDINSVTPGYGFYTFGSDYTTGTVNAVYVVAAGNAFGNGLYVRMFEYDGTRIDASSSISAASASTAIEVNDAGSNHKPIFYYGDGGLRVCDGNFDNTTSVNKWIGYASGNQFSSSTRIVSLNKWIYGNQYLSGASSGIADPNIIKVATSSVFDSGDSTHVNLSVWAGLTTDLNDGQYAVVNHTDATVAKINNFTVTSGVGTDSITPAAYDSGDELSITPQPGVGFNFNVASTITGDINRGTYRFYQSFILKGGQETKPAIMDGTLTNSADGWGFSSMAVICTSPFDNRVIGGRIYTKKDGDSEYYMLMDISLNDGVRTGLTEEYTDWKAFACTGASDLSDNIVYYTTETSKDAIGIDTYASLNGYDPDDIITPKYGTATIANRRAYIGNIEMSSDNSKLRDTVFKSLPNKFDTFLSFNRLDVVNDDGEQVIKLEYFNDRLFEFKEQTLYIINVGSDVEYLEYRNPFLGVTKPYHTCVTEKGIAIMNDNGVYLHDGENYINLLLKKDQVKRLISDEDWKGFFSDNSAIGYDPIKKQIVIVDNVDSISSSREFDIERYFWNKYSSVASDITGDITNLITNFENQIAVFEVGSDSIFVKSSALSSSSNIAVVTKRYDFGRPDTLKHLYKVIVRSKNGNGKVKIKYRNRSDVDRDFSTSYISTTTQLSEEEYTVPALANPSRDRNVFGLSFSANTSAVDSNFEIDEIRFIYREKEDR